MGTTIHRRVSGWVYQYIDRVSGWVYQYIDRVSGWVLPYTEVVDGRFKNEMSTTIIKVSLTCHTE
jgi:hypothetical protein